MKLNQGKQRFSLALVAIVFVLAVLGLTLLGSAVSAAPLTARGSLAIDPIVFGVPTNYRVDILPFHIATADLNHDGKPDLVTTPGESAGGSSPPNVSVLLASGAGAFQASVDYPVSGLPNSVAIGDLNGDGNPDLATSNGSGNTVSVLLGVGNGTFWTKTDYAAPTNPFGIAIADLNGDSKPDLAATSRDTNQVSVLLGNGNGTFGAATLYPTGAQPGFIAVADLNGDGKPDLVTADIDAAKVSVLLGNGNGTLQPPVDYAVDMNGFASVAIGDLNGDGKPDIVASNHEGNGGGGSASVLLGNGNGTFQPAVNYPVPVGSTIHLVVLGDMNGDGHLDIVIGSHTQVAILLGIGDGTFDPPSFYPSGAQTPIAVAVVDFNADGKVDLATGNYASKTVSVLLNLGVKAPPPKPVSCVVPNVRGKTLSAASKKIKAAHCRVGKVRRAYSKAVAKGRIVSQKPRPKTKLASGAKVNLVVSRGRKR